MDKEVQTHLKRQQWWQKYTNLRKSLRVIIIMVPLIKIVNVIMSLPVTVAVPVSIAEDVCQTPGCITAASRVLRWMDETVEPCDDFYNFACGKFLNETKISDDRLWEDIFSKGARKLGKQLADLISDKVSKNNMGPLNRPFILVKKFLEACINATSRKDSGLEVKSMFSIMDELGGWPVVEGYKWDRNSDWSWTWAVAKFRKLGYSMDYIFSFTIAADMKNSTARIIYIDQADLNVKADDLKIEGYVEKLNEIFNDMVEMAVWFGADRERAKKDLGKSLEFETKLAKMSLLEEERRDDRALYNQYTLKQVQRMYPYIEWVKYINALLPSPLSVDKNEIIVVMVPSYFESLRQLLKNTPKHTIANYLMWRVIQFLTPFWNGIYDPETYDTRRKDCINIISGNMGAHTENVGTVMSRVIGALYARKYFRQDSKVAVLEMADGIRNEFERILNKVDWMDNETRKSALDKIKAMSSLIGYPDELMDDEKTEKYYKNLKINENNYLESVLNVIKFDSDHEFSKLRKPVDNDEWIDYSSPTKFTGFYLRFQNSIVIPVVLLQWRFFSANRPRYMNFGAIGQYISHEIIHGFDDRQLDHNGNLQNLWKKSSEERYLEKVNCLIEQYGNYTEPSTGLKLNGILTQGENIADNGGIKLAYLAYQKWVEKNGPEPKLPGLNYTPQQMFWISAAQMWCAVHDPDTIHSKLSVDWHSPARFRVLGPFSNQKEFAKDFHCPIDSPMNPTKKCEVW